MESQENVSKQKQASPNPAVKIKITEDGPYIVSGGVPLDEKIITPVGGHREYHTGRTLSQASTYALCRCGHSKNPPFCDGAHVAAHFNGAETASKKPFEQRAEITYGEGIDLFDDYRCAFARFCHREEGDVWNLTEGSGDPLLKEEAVKASADCPAGRLVHYDKEGNALEPDLTPSISILQDPEKKVSCAIFVKGGIPLESSDGTAYELRNRYALCRCGASKNKPFCDASHVNIGFQAD